MMPNPHLPNPHLPSHPLATRRIHAALVAITLALLPAPPAFAATRPGAADVTSVSTHRHHHRSDDADLPAPTLAGLRDDSGRIRGDAIDPNNAAPAPVSGGAVSGASPGEAPAFQFLDPAAFQPEIVFAPAPPRASDIEDQEVARIHALINAATPQRMLQAIWDAEHTDPSIYDKALGVQLELKPETWELLVLIEREVTAVVVPAKASFHRARPYVVDPHIPRCDGDAQLGDDRSYPSGHAAVGYAMGWALARLMPEKAPVILDRAREYAVSREVCGVHFQSDTEASHGVADVVAEKLLEDPRLTRLITDSRRELAKKR